MSTMVQVVLVSAAVVLAAVRKQMAREFDPATPPWLTVRFWLSVTALACSVAALTMAA